MITWVHLEESCVCVCVGSSLQLNMIMSFLCGAASRHSALLSHPDPGSAAASKHHILHPIMTENIHLRLFILFKSCKSRILSPIVTVPGKIEYHTQCICYMAKSIRTANHALHLWVLYSNSPPAAGFSLSSRC